MVIRRQLLICERTVHCNLSSSSSEASMCQDQFGKPWSVVQPELRDLDPLRKKGCSTQAYGPLHQLLQELTKTNSFSIRTAETMVQTVGIITGLRRGHH